MVGGSGKCLWEVRVEVGMVSGNGRREWEVGLVNGNWR